MNEDMSRHVDWPDPESDMWVAEVITSISNEDTMNTHGYVIIMRTPVGLVACSEYGSCYIYSTYPQASNFMQAKQEIIQSTEYRKMQAKVVKILEKHGIS